MSRQVPLALAVSLALLSNLAACSSSTPRTGATSGSGGGSGSESAGTTSGSGGNGLAAGAAGAPATSGAGYAGSTSVADGGNASSQSGGAGGVAGTGGATRVAGAGGAIAGSAGSAGIAGGAGTGGGAGPTLGTLACGTPWNNPAKGVTWIHDPSLTREGNVYYLFSTPAPVVAPAVRGLVPFNTSTDGVTWSTGQNLFQTALPWWSADIPLPETWASDVHRVNGTYYVYYSISAWGNFNSSIGLATNGTLDPQNPNYHWVDQGKVIDFRNGGAGVNVIDPDLFVDDDGSFWLVYGSFKTGLRLVQLDPHSGKLLKDPPNVTVLTNGLGEGSDIIKHAGYYYLLLSTGTCCSGLQSTYHVGMGRSQTLSGPYLTKANTRLLDGAYTTLLAGDSTHPGQGGQSVYEENGQRYLVYHAYTAPTGDPVINVRPLFFDQSGWPTLDPCQAAP
jgi:arabinan endo-1,5-alpha-L-arabinosidase